LDDPEVVESLRFIREHAVEGINVSDVVKRLPISRTSLETKFKALVGRTIHDAIRKVQLDRAKELIACSNQPLKVIAANSGFAHIQHMTNLFRRFVGQTPSEYRRNAHQPGAKY
jgi:LacI family transcriptional regulator